MLKTVEEIKDVEIKAGVIVNGVDNANLMSVDSTEPVETKADSTDKLDEDSDTSKKEEVEVKKEEKETEGEGKKEDIVDDSLEKEEPNAKKKEEKKVDNGLAAKPDDSKKVQKRIGGLTKKWRTAERERDFEKEKRLEVEKKLEELSSKIPVEGRPQKKDFDDEDDYIEALTDWKIDNKLRQSQEKSTKKEKEKEEKDAVIDTYNGLDDALEQGRDKYEDFDELVQDENLIITPTVTQITLDTEIPEDILYYLASNPEESERISNLDPVRSGMEIAKIEVKLINETEVEVEKESELEPKIEQPKPTKKQSKAPAPIVPVQTDGVIEKDPEKMSPKEYRAYRESQKT
ncbi:MAG: hypothetical protein GY714_20300 [Desulfobacterales bacterium]|nr:hypothetical protein [Desulfobacterales bacterium]